jgi:HlyD family secretion protein
MAKGKSKLFWIIVLFFALGASAVAVWWFYVREPPLNAFVSGNGRIEATEVDVATKFQGRIAEILVDEGDMVDAGQIVARMDTRSLEAQLKRAQANVLQSRRELSNDKFVVAQRRSEYMLAKKNLARADTLLKKGIIAEQEYDVRLASKQTAKDALAAAEAQVTVTEAKIEATLAETELIKSEIDDSILKAPIRGRVEFRLAEPGEVLASGGKVLALMGLTDVYMTIFLRETQVGKVALGTEARMILDAAPNYVIPGHVSFVASEAQFTPKQVETRTEREKLMFRVKVQIPIDILIKHEPYVKTGLPGVAYVRLDSNAKWPEHLQTRLP